MNSAYIKTNKVFFLSTTYSMIMARDLAGGIGINNGLPWPKSKIDMEWFRQHTMGKVIIMGRSTFESMGSKPLPGRVNIVMSTTLDPQVARDYNKANENDISKGYLVFVKDKEQAKKFIDDSVGLLHRGGEVMVIGGATIYSAFWDDCSRLYLTTFNGIFDSDVQVQFPLDNFECVYLDKRSLINPKFEIFDCIKDDITPLTFTREEIKQCLKSLTI